MPSKLDAFHEAVQSLKLYRRAELPGQDNDPNIIKKLYVDPLPSNYIFSTVIKPNTTFVIGRKGTGKSTIFQRIQNEIKSDDKRKTSAYIDIKTIFESSKISSSLYEKIENSNLALPKEEAEKILLFKYFITAIIKEIKNELSKRVESSFLEVIKEAFTGNYHELFEELDELIESIGKDEFFSVLGIKSLDKKESSSQAATLQDSASAQLTLSSDFEANAGLEHQASKSLSSNDEITYKDILVKLFDIKDLLSKLRKILSVIGVRNLYILIDDFSELPEEAMKAVVDLLLAPLNNWSEEFIKLKIAAYPGRIYYGNIDKTKIDEIYLDIYELYGSSDVGSMEDNATEFVRRLVTTRLDIYGAGGILDFFENDSSEIWKTLFYTTMANPRIIGYILSFCHETHLLYGRKIGLKALQQASRRYYDQKVETYFGIAKFLHESFGEKSSIYSLKELLELIVNRSKELRTHESELFNSIDGRPPTSHFYIFVELESVLSTLELNFFLTKYYQLSDRDGRKVAIYCLNYGLCQKYTLNFGKPTGRSYRRYFVERVFDYTSIIQKYIAQNQEIVCSNCGYKYSTNDLEAIKWNKMRCRECLEGTCEVINLSRKYEEDLRRIDKQLLLPSIELGMLQTLHQDNKELYASDIAAELDCSYQLVGKRGRFLNEKGLVTRGNNESGRRVFLITNLAEESYFSDQESQSLDIDINDQL